MNIFDIFVCTASRARFRVGAVAQGKFAVTDCERTFASLINQATRLNYDIVICVQLKLILSRNVWTQRPG